MKNESCNNQNQLIFFDHIKVLNGNRENKVLNTTEYLCVSEIIYFYDEI